MQHPRVKKLTKGFPSGQIDPSTKKSNNNNSNNSNNNNSIGNNNNIKAK